MNYLKKLSFILAATLISTAAVAQAANHVTPVTAPYQYVSAPVSKGNSDSGQIVVPADAHSCAIGSISVQEYGSAPFKATVTFSDRAGDNSASASISEKTFYYQIAQQATTNGIGTIASCPAKQGINKVVQPGATVYVNVTAQQKGSFTISYFHRPAQ